jgi:hypothetical protein
LANIERCVPYLEQTTQTKIFKTATWQCFSWETYTWQDNNTKIKFYVKIIARLKLRNGNQDILFVAKYPIKLNIKELPDNLPLNLSYAINSSPENLSEDIVIPDGTTYSQNTTVRALNTISFGNVVLTNGARLNLEAGQIIARQNAVINPNISIKAVNLYGNNSPQSPANPSQILTFCNSSVYKVPSRYQSREEEEKEFSIKKEEKEAINLSASPNPTKSDVTISYVLEQDAKVLVYLSNIMGERVYTLTDKEQAKGLQEVTFSTHALPAGIYLYTLETEHHKITKRLVVIK